MNPATRAKAIFISACAFAAFLVVFGFKLFQSKDSEFTNTEFFIIGVVFVLAGIVIVSAGDYVRKRWLIGYSLIAVGFYMFGRASGVIKEPWLAYVAGAACLASAAIVVYVARPRLRGTSAPGEIRPEVPSERTERL